MPTVSVRYIVNDVDPAIRFYVDQLGFTEVMHPAPTFAMLERGDLRLVLSQPSGAPGGGGALPGGSVPTPGGWNRFAIEVADIDRSLSALTNAGTHARSPIINGVGGRQVIVDDPSGNPVELFEPGVPDAKLRA
jgi:catechol 2,3-dioxygenase-like lactoylglutathione lyase family enzyme